MQRHEFPDFRALLDAQAAVFRAAKPDDVLVQAYWSALKDVSLDAVRSCAALHTKRGKFFPKPFELRPKDWAPLAQAPGSIDFSADLERLAGVPASQAIGDHALRGKLEAQLAWLTSGPNETPGSRMAFAASYWRSVETWLEWQLEGKHMQARRGAMA